MDFHYLIHVSREAPNSHLNSRKCSSGLMVRVDPIAKRRSPQPLRNVDLHSDAVARDLTYVSLLSVFPALPYVSFPCVCRLFVSQLCTFPPFSVVSLLNAFSGVPPPVSLLQYSHSNNVVRAQPELVKAPEQICSIAGDLTLEGERSHRWGYVSEGMSCRNSFLLHEMMAENYLRYEQTSPCRPYSKMRKSGWRAYLVTTKKSVNREGDHAI